MDQQTIETLKQALEEKKDALEKELGSFAVKDKETEGDWDSTFPRVPEGNIEEAADEVEEYSTNLPIESSLENQLADVNFALEKIEKGSYGMCENCAMPVEEARLRVLPEARTCESCSAKK